MGEFNPGQLAVGATFHGRYQIVRRIKAGGMGAVYEVIHLETRRRRALKVMLPSVVSDPELRDRFKQEATIAAEITSDHIVETFDAGIEPHTGTPFLVMELLQGEELAQVLKERGRLSPADVVTLLAQAALALDKTHAAGIVHRDLKPENLFITQRDDGSIRLKVLDFGIAKVVAQGGKSNNTTRALGSPLYMSPEQLRGRGDIGPPADIYALAHVAYLLLTGTSYWDTEKRETDNIYSLMVKIGEGVREAASVRAARAGVELPPAFDVWFAMATAIRPEDRYQRASSLVASLAKVLGQPVPQLSPEVIRTRTPISSGRVLPAVSSPPDAVTLLASTQAPTPAGVSVTAPMQPARRPASAGLRVAVAAVVLAAALAMVSALGISYFNNRRLEASTQRIAAAAAAVDWTDAGDPIQKLDRLDALRAHIKVLDSYRENGPPLLYSFGMYRGDRSFKAAVDQYEASLREAFVKPTKVSLEKQLRGATGASYAEDYNALKAYLLLGDQHRGRLAEDDEAAGQKARLLRVWMENLRKGSAQVDEAVLKPKLEPHVAYFVVLLQRSAVPGEPLDQALVDGARDALRRAGVTGRYYDRYVSVLADERFDPNAPGTAENLKYPPVTLAEVFSDRPVVLTKVRSREKERTGKWFEVRGPYTSKGHKQVVGSLERATGASGREEWVVPLPRPEVERALARVRQDYDVEYITQWSNFFRDIAVDMPAGDSDAISELRILATPDWPYLRLLRLLAEHTQHPQLGDRLDPVPGKFRSMVRFGVPAPQPKTEGAAAPPPGELAKYVAALIQLLGELEAIRDRPSPGDAAKSTAAAEAALKQTRALLLTMDETGQDLLGPILIFPLRGMVRSGLPQTPPSAAPLPPGNR
jgi:serine/threonine protein kinase